MKNVKIGIIGTGTMSNFHIGGILNNPYAELYALCDVNEATVKQAAEKYGVDRWYTDMDEMLKLSELDAVVITTGNKYHAPCTIAALNAGKHVLCEKPMSVSLADAEQMKQTAEKNGKLLMIGVEFRFSTDVSIVKEAVDKGQFGEVYYCKGVNHRRNGHPGGWFGSKQLASGGVMVDCGVHLLDAFYYIAGAPKAVSVYAATFNKIGMRSNIKTTSQSYKSIASSSNDTSDVEYLASALIRFENGAVLSLEASYAINIEKDFMEFSVLGTKAGSNFNGHRLALYSEMNNYLTNTLFETSTERDFVQLICQETDHFVSCIREGTPCISPAKDGVEMMRILEAIYKSGETGHEVIL